MKVGLLTIEQKNEITGQLYAEDSYFNPIQDIIMIGLFLHKKWSNVLTQIFCGLKIYH